VAKTHASDDPCHRPPFLIIRHESQAGPIRGAPSPDGRRLKAQ
jgi:hypothetical protein